jgi:predicted DNA-binding transcriptional regulator AlpA
MGANMSNTKGRLLKVGEVAELFQVTSKTVAAWERKGQLPKAVTSPGGQRRFKVEDIVPLLRKYGYAIPDELAEASPKDTGGVIATGSAS